MVIKTEELKPELWNEVEKLFSSSKEECNTCWCMNHRVKPENEIIGEEARNALKKLILNKKAYGVLAFNNNEPIGWCAIDKREDLLGHDCTYPFESRDKSKIWSIHCFYISPEYRGKGVSKLLITHALKLLKNYGAKKVEGYPTLPKNLNNEREEVENFSGKYSIFEKNGFKIEEEINSFYARVSKELY